jgi:hypothetical protein
MAEFAIHTLDSAPDGSKQPLVSLQQGLGFIPNLAATMAESPTLIEAFIRLQQSLSRSTLTGVEREVVGLRSASRTAANTPWPPTRRSPNGRAPPTR